MKKQNLITSWDEVPILMDLPYVCVIVGQSYDCLKKKCIAGNFPAFKIGKEWRISKDSLIEYINTQKLDNLKRCKKGLDNKKLGGNKNNEKKGINYNNDSVNN